MTSWYNIIVAWSSFLKAGFDYWIENTVGDRAPNTCREYRERYVHNIQPYIGRMLMTEVKPMRCKMVLNNMEKTY